MNIESLRRRFPNATEEQLQKQIKLWQKMTANIDRNGKDSNSKKAQESMKDALNFQSIMQSVKDGDSLGATIDKATGGITADMRAGNALVQSKTQNWWNDGRYYRRESRMRLCKVRLI
jgi:hypothetical protein